jgi:hypothetical protein
MRLPLELLEEYAQIDKALWALSNCYHDDTRCDPVKLLDSYRQCLGWVNVSGDIPIEFTFEGQPAPLKGFGIDVRGKPISCFPSQIHAVSLMLDVLECRNTREPMYHQIEQTIRGVHRVYRRLLAPFEDNQGQVDRVFYAIRWMIEPVMLVEPFVERS